MFPSDDIRREAPCSTTFGGRHAEVRSQARGKSSVHSLSDIRYRPLMGIAMAAAAIHAVSR